MSVNNTLAERGSRYGAFADHAKIAQGLQDVMRAAPKWQYLDQDQKQSLSVIADKIARILNGDPYYADNWHDIQGYAKLIEDRLNMIPTNEQELFEPVEEEVLPLYDKNSPLTQRQPWMLNGNIPISHGFPSVGVPGPG